MGDYPISFNGLDASANQSLSQQQARLWALLRKIDPTETATGYARFPLLEVQRQFAMDWEFREVTGSSIRLELPNAPLLYLTSATAVSIAALATPNPRKPRVIAIVNGNDVGGNAFAFTRLAAGYPVEEQLMQRVASYVMAIGATSWWAFQPDPRGRRTGWQCLATM
jgi:hypothetical protein